MDLTQPHSIPAPTVIFVRPQAEGNIGALSRVLANFGCSDLRLVGEGPAKPLDPTNDFSKMDWAMAKGGQKVLENSKWYPNLQLASADFHLVLGSSGKVDHVDHSYSRPLLNPSTAFQFLSQHFVESQGTPFKWALVMGPEHDGLDSVEQSFCNALIHIDTRPDCPSMNIAVAVACLLYHFTLYKHDKPNKDLNTESFPTEHMDTNQLSTLGDKNALVDYVIDCLKLTSFFKYPDHSAVAARTRRILQSLKIPRGELLFIFEIFYQLKSWGNKKFEDRNFLTREKSTKK